MSNVKSRRSIASNSSDEVDLGRLVSTLLDGKYLIISTTLAFAIIGVLVALLSTPIYRADALVQVEESSGGASALTGELGDIFAADSSAVTEIEVLKSRMVLGRTVDELGLTNVANPIYFPVVGRGLSRLFGSEHSIQLDVLEVPSELIGHPFRLVVSTSSDYQLFNDGGELLLRGEVDKLAEGNGVRLMISRISAKPGDEFRIVKRHWLQAVGDLQQSISVSERGKNSGVLSLAFEGESPDTIREILSSVTNYYVAQNVAREAEQAQRSLDFLEQELPDVRSRLSESEARLDQYRQQRESVDLSREAQALLDSSVELESRLNDLRLQEAEIAQRYTPEHPAYRALSENRETLLQRRAELDSRIQALPETQREIISRTRELEVNQAVYTTLLNRVQELTVVKAGTVGYVRIVDEATTGLRPVKPKKPLIAVLATMLGAMVGIGIVLIRAFLNPGLTESAGVEDMGLAVYGNIPFSLDALQGPNRKRTDRIPLAIKNPADIAIEAIRALRTSIHFAQMDAKNNIVMISGAAPGAGKSFLASNLAVSLQSSGQRVLLIDADLRRGHLHREFGVGKQHGLAEYLQGETNDISAAISSTQLESLDLVTIGSRPPNPSELLMHRRFEALLGWASEHYDTVLVDTPPVLAVTDAEIVGRLSGVNLLVGRYQEITLKELERAVERFESSGVKVNAFILNAVKRTRRSTYDYGYYHYDYANEAT